MSQTLKFWKIFVTLKGAKVAKGKKVLQMLKKVAYNKINTKCRAALNSTIIKKYILPPTGKNWCITRNL